jgi:hypothetical protein
MELYATTISIVVNDMVTGEQCRIEFVNRCFGGACPPPLDDKLLMPNRRDAWYLSKMLPFGRRTTAPFVSAVFMHK